jgi:tRNA-uridine 2-sulfurtransferase
MTHKPKVLVGLSGGVDSSVSAALLVEQGYEVIGAFMKNWSQREEVARRRGVGGGEGFEECGWKRERRDAARVAAKLGIPFVTFDFEQEYREKVVENLFDESWAGRTPNPDVLCNKYIKFDRFVKEADRLGCEFIATGHYARVKHRGTSHQALGTSLLMGKDSNKDQTYFLWAIKPEILSRVLFPIGDMEKPAVREKARELRLSTAEKKDSTGICFVGEVHMREFLQARLPKDPGSIVTVDGDVIGEHEGLAFYTIGQRHGLNVGGGTPWYVVKKRPKAKELVVASNFHPSLYAEHLTAKDLNWFVTPEYPIRCMARIRYRQALQACLVELNGEDSIKVTFDEPQRAITSGQSIVLYRVEEVLGGGIIE